MSIQIYHSNGHKQWMIVKHDAHIPAEAAAIHAHPHATQYSHRQTKQLGEQESDEIIFVAIWIRVDDFSSHFVVNHFC